MHPIPEQTNYLMEVKSKLKQIAKQMVFVLVNEEEEKRLLLERGWWL